MICKKFVIFFGNNVILCNPHVTIRSGFSLSLEVYPGLPPRYPMKLQFSFPMLLPFYLSQLTKKQESLLPTFMFWQKAFFISTINGKKSGYCQYGQ